jgi:hypothetical protein
MAGYIATEAAADEGGYEASTSVFSTDSGRLLVAESQRLLASLPSAPPSGTPPRMA